MTAPTLHVGQYATYQDRKGAAVRCKVVGFSKNVRGETTDNNAFPWAVIVEQSGNYRLGWMRQRALTPLPLVAK